MSTLESPRPEELFPEGDGRLAPNEEDSASMEEREDQHDETFQEITERPAVSSKPVEPPGNRSQEQWGRLKSKEKGYFPLNVSPEAACMFEDEEKKALIAKRMRELAYEVEMAQMPQDVAPVAHTMMHMSMNSQNIEECGVSYSKQCA